MSLWSVLSGKDDREYELNAEVMGLAEAAADARDRALAAVAEIEALNEESRARLARRPSWLRKSVRVARRRHGA